MRVYVKLANFTAKSRLTCERINQQIPTVAKEYSHKNSVELSMFLKNFVETRLGGEFWPGDVMCKNGY